MQYGVGFWLLVVQVGFCNSITRLTGYEGSDLLEDA